jgi:hypothetical protein
MLAQESLAVWRKVFVDSSELSEAFDRECWRPRVVRREHSLIVNVRVFFTVVKGRSGFHKKAVRYRSMHTYGCIKLLRHPTNPYNTQ